MIFKNPQRLINDDIRGKTQTICGFGVFFTSIFPFSVFLASKKKYIAPISGHLIIYHILQILI